MAPQKPKREDPLCGAVVCAPRSLWPGYPLPAGQAGFHGTVGKKKGSTQHFVTFPDDDAKYFFDDSLIEQWLVEDAKAGSTSKAAPKRKADAVRPAAAAGAAGAAPAEQPSKKAKATADPAAAKATSVVKSPGKAPKEADDTQAKSRLRAALDSALDLLDMRGLEEVYRTALEAKKLL